MKLFDVTFIRLSSAPRNVFNVQFEVEAVCAKKAIQRAEAELRRERLNRSHFQKFVQTRIVTNIQPQDKDAA